MGFSDAGICLSDQNNLCEKELGFSDQSVQEFRPDQDLETKVGEIPNTPREGVKVKEEEEDLCKTPTRLDQILPKITNICPPAPRKPKRVPSRSLKVRDSYRSRRMIILNVSREIDSMFHSASLGNQVKRARRI
ncbi:Cyclin-dependent protein kinase inhibitor SMR10 [Hirschfeldia incana]|nr:Cyclin-dependent protein kinase inhibitor SMR10 [Hirschfeldia incana]